MLQRKPGCPCGGGCPRCQEEALMQTKSKANAQGDKYEPKANRLAEEVMRMPEPMLQRQVKPEEKGGGNSCEVSITPVESLVLKQFGNTNLTWAGQIRASTFGVGILTVRSSVLEALEEPQIKLKEIVDASKPMTFDCTSKCTIDKDIGFDNFAIAEPFMYQKTEGYVTIQIRTTNKSPSQMSTELTASVNWSGSKYQSQKVVESKCRPK